MDELLSQAAPSPQELQEARGFLQTMDQSARRMGGMLDGLLALARAARTPMQWQPIALQELLEQARTAVLAQPRWAACGAAARLQWSLPQQSPAVRADAALLRQVLEALLDNAVKFTQPVAQPRIAIDVERHADGGITLSVTDNGVGSTPRVRARCSASSSACTVSRSFRAWARAWPWCAASCAATAARPPSAPRPRAAAAYA